MKIRKKLCSLARAVALLVSVAAAAAETPAGWWRDAVFYEIFVRSFADATTGPLAQDGIGDLQGLIERLDYLNDGDPRTETDLGVTALWLMPLHPSPSYHGYDVTDYFAVNPQYGDTALMKRLVAEAHRRGIRVIIDFVPNHASSEHPLFRRAVAGGPDAPERRMFRFAPLPEEISGVWGGEHRVWHPAPDGSFFYGIFTHEMPDWNFRETAVTEHHRRFADHWLREIGVDGLRLDAVRYLFEDGEHAQDLAETKAWLREFTAHCHRIAPGAFTIGEVAAGTALTADYLNAHALDSLFEFGFARATVEAVRFGRAGIYAQQLARMQRDYGARADWATFLSNHDQERIASQLEGDERKLRFAAGLFLTAPGVPFLYYGEEIGMTGRKPDPDIRTPMQWNGEAGAGFTTSAVAPWRAINGDSRQRNVAAQTGDSASLLAHYRRLVRLNASSPALRRGDPVPVTVGADNVYAALRQTDAEVVLVLANFNDTPVRGAKVTAGATNLRTGWPAANELAEAPVAGLTPAADGSFRDWAPVPELPGRSVTVIRWRRP